MMPQIGIVRGFGEGYAATGFLIKIVKALNRRFRSKISFCEIPAGDYTEFGGDLSNNAIELMKQCDCIFVGDMNGRANPLKYTVSDIAMAFSDNIEYTCISGLGNFSQIDINIATYFDGGFHFRDTCITPDGRSETRICSLHTVKNVVKHVSRNCENRRRRLAFVEDKENEYCNDLFHSKFEDFTLPLTNFRMISFTTRDITHVLLYDPSQFDTIFASKTFAEITCGLFLAKMQEGFAGYSKHMSQMPIYSVKSMYTNSFCADSVPSASSYIVAFCDLLSQELHLEKEAIHLRKALDDVVNEGKSGLEGEVFINSVIELLNRPVTTKHYKKVKTRYLR